MTRGLVSQAAYRLEVVGVRSWSPEDAEGPRLGLVPAPAPPVSPSPRACLNHFRHHSPALGPGDHELDGPNKISGMSPRPLSRGPSPSCTTEPDPKVKVPASPHPKQMDSTESAPKENRDGVGKAQIPQATVAPLALVKSRPGTVSPMASPLATPAFKDSIPPCSPGPKRAAAPPRSGAPFPHPLPAGLVPLLSPGKHVTHWDGKTRTKVTGIPPTVRMQTAWVPALQPVSNLSNPLRATG